MQFSTVAMISALAVSASAYGNSSIAAVWVTDVVTSFVTVCPAATSFSFNGVTYTATELCAVDSEEPKPRDLPCLRFKIGVRLSPSPTAHVQSPSQFTPPLPSSATPGMCFHDTEKSHLRIILTFSSTAAPTAPASSAAISSAPAWGNSTAPAATGGVTTSKGSVSTSSAGSSPSASTTAPIVVSNNGNRAIALSGASFAGLLGVAAYIL
ncbi:hypothetical protein BPOR_1084g00020 [Botrytis porri]|uniref:Uncharacterized protein n=1 Tax=Botrytis porri TaxID=87229 RepID=A0A4Z1K681_9HELO|nr:hypothetical protein BPOR_1084g00020 [Botrytis porri]